MISDRRKKTLDGLVDEKSQLIIKKHELTREIWNIETRERTIDELLKKYGKEENYIRQNDICR